jgi:hypothetical protein
MTTALLDVLETPCCRDFATAWMRWRGDEMVPRRRDIELSEIAQYLGWLSVLEVQSADEMVFRLVGTAINETRGQELTGRTLRSLSHAEDWPARSRSNMEIVGHPCGLYFRVLFDYTIGSSAYTEYLCLPVFADADGASGQVFSIRQPVEDVSLRLPQVQQDYNEFGEDNCFVDLGNGTPDSKLLGQNNPPLKL